MQKDIIIITSSRMIGWKDQKLEMNLSFNFHVSCQPPADLFLLIQLDLHSKTFHQPTTIIFFAFDLCLSTCRNFLSHILTPIVEIVFLHVAFPLQHPNAFWMKLSKCMCRLDHSQNCPNAWCVGDASKCIWKK